MAYVRLIEDSQGRAFRAGESGTPYPFDVENDGALTKSFQAAVAEALVDGKIGELEGTERDMARLMSEQVGIRKDAADSLMIAWYPPAELAAELVKLMPGGVAAEKLHLTICYLGDPDADGSGPWDVTHVAAVVKCFSMRYCYPMKGEVTGIGRFVGPEDTDVVIALVDVPGLAEMRRCLVDELSCAGAVPYNSPIFNQEHGFIPHITLAYTPKTQASAVKLDEVIPFTVDNLSMVVGADKAVFMMPPNTEAVDEEGFAYHYAAVNARAALPEDPEVEVVVNERLREAIAADALGVDKSAKDALAYSIIEKSTDEELRYTMGPLYVPERKDAHGEGVEAETLQKAVWDFVKESSGSGRRINLQHLDYGDVQVGEWVEVMAWPYEHEISLTKADGESRKVTMPAGTVYMGVRWDDDAWPLVKAGKLGGYSIGGKAVHVAVDDDWLPMHGMEKADAATYKPHAYEDDGTGKCQLCELSRGAGNHTSKEAD